MEIRFSFFQISFSFLIFVLLASKIMQRFGTKKSKLSLSPGPRKLPLIGNMHQLIGSNMPHHKLRDLSDIYGSLMHLKLGEITTIVVSSAEAAKEIMKTHDINFASKPFLLAADIAAYGSTDITFSPYGEYWKQLRKICINELLSRKCVQSFRSIREEEVLNIVTLISLEGKKGSVVNISKEIFSMTFRITSRAAFGKECKDQEEFILLVKDGIQLAAGFSVAELFPSLNLFIISLELKDYITGTKRELERIHRRMDRIFEDILNEHISALEEKMDREDGRNKDLIDVLLNLQRNGELEFSLTNNNIKAVILDVFSAGTESSSTTIEWAVSQMLKNPRILKKAQEEVRRVFDPKGHVDEANINELHYLKSIIKETLRLHLPGPLLVPRECRETCEIFGCKIPVGTTKIVVNAWDLGRDSKYWSKADIFYLERFVDSSVDYKGNNFEYIPFGARRRICPGILFTLPNIELPLACLLYYFDWKLPNGEKPEGVDMSEVFGAAVKRKN